MFKKILVPLDGSLLSQRALEPAVALADQTGATLLLVRAPVADTLSFAVSEAGQAELRREVLTYLDSIRASTERPNLSPTTQLIEGDVASAIIDVAVSQQVDLIIMSTHGYSGLTRWVLGSVTEKVLRSAPCPVLAVRVARRPQKILITLDGSELSEGALEPGLSLAQGLGADAILLRTVPQLTLPASNADERDLNQQQQHDLIEEAEAYLQARSVSYTRSGVAIKTEVSIGPAAEKILEYIEVFGIDLIVMATHGRTGLKRWVYGSVTAKVLRGVSCSMVVIRPTESELK